MKPVATLLAARHRADRRTAPELPERFEDATAAVDVLQERCRVIDQRRTWSGKSS
jgi:hypothetical protein